MSRIFLFLLAVGSLTAQNWTDRGEYDQVLAVRAEATSSRKLALLEEWKRKYPKSDLAPMRAELAIATQQALGDTAGALTAARELVTLAPQNFTGQYWVTVLAPGSKAPSSAELVQLETTAKALLASSGAYFQSRKSEDAGLPAHVEFASHRALGWSAWMQGKHEEAEKEFRLCLKSDPQQSEISAWLGTVLAIKDKQVEALFHLDRAVYLPGDNLVASSRNEVRTILEGLYVRYHGSTDGLDQLGAMSKASAMPPADLAIESAEQLRMRRQDEELIRLNPDIAAWLKLRRQLEAKDGAATFEKLKGVGMPRLRGFIVRCDAATVPITEVLVAMADTPGIASVVLNFSSPMPACAPENTVIEFEGVPTAFTNQPFLLKLQVDTTKLSGWPEPAPAVKERK